MAKVDGTGTFSTDLGKWWLVGLLGLLAIAAGVLALVYPNITLLALGFGLLTMQRVEMYIRAKRLLEEARPS